MKRFWCSLRLKFKNLLISVKECNKRHLKNVTSYYRICDKCGKQSEYAESYNEALYKARKAGWIHYAAEDKDYCPECKNLAIFNHELKEQQ